MNRPDDSLITYPCDFPIKIMGVTQDGFAQTMVDVVLLHDPEFRADSHDPGPLLPLPPSPSPLTTLLFEPFPPLPPP